MAVKLAEGEEFLMSWMLGAVEDLPGDILAWEGILHSSLGCRDHWLLLWGDGHCSGADNYYIQELHSLGVHQGDQSIPQVRVVLQDDSWEDNLVQEGEGQLERPCLQIQRTLNIGKRKCTEHIQTT